MKDKRQSIAIDMDGVIADTVAQFILWHNRENEMQLDRASFEGRPESEAVPSGKIWQYVNSPGFFRDVPVMEGAIDAVQTLMNNYDVFIVSAAMEFANSLYDKKCWLEEHFPFISWTNIVFCGSKRIIGTDYLIDDHTKNLDHFPGRSIIFTAGHNLEVSHHPRIGNWKEALSFFGVGDSKGIGS